MIGNPARIVGYVSDNEAVPHEIDRGWHEVAETAVLVGNLNRMRSFTDTHGSRSMGDFKRFLPFLASRYFLVYGILTQEARGERVPKLGHQFLICVSGSVRVLADDRSRRIDVLLVSPDHGIHLPPLIRDTQSKYSKDAVWLVFTSESCDSHEYIRDYARSKRVAHDGD